jgi:carbon-monoxide dehydrogenase large subunit
LRFRDSKIRLNFSADVKNAANAPNGPLGAKGARESATTGAPAAVMNALADALHSAGAEAVDMPATPETVWRALRTAGAS